jgi:dihydroorotate dehydrogenase
MKYNISNIEFQHPILNASGCWVIEEELLEENTNKEFLVEINVSCPNTVNEIVGYSTNEMEALFVFLQKLNLKNIKFGLKLPPYLEVVPNYLTNTMI